MVAEPSANHLTPPGIPGTQRGRFRHIARNTLMVSACFGVAALAGVLRNALIAGRYGIGSDLDAYYAAFKIPDLLFTLVAGGALATAFIPVFVENLTEEGHVAAWRLTSAITNLVVLITTALALCVAVGAPWLVRTILAPGFTVAQQAETVELMRIVLVSTVIFSISAVQGSALHGFKHFLLPALAPVVYPLGIAAGAVWLPPDWGVRGLAWGAVIGSVLHLLIKVPALIRYRFQWWPVLGTARPAVRRVAVLMGPRILDLGVFHLTLLATTNLASRLGSGSVSALEWGWDAMQLPETIIGTAFGLVAFPTLADLAVRHDRNGLRATLGQTLRAVLALSVPAAAGLILLGRPLLQLLYQRGAFDAAATEAVATALRYYALGLTAHCCLELATRSFFAEQDTVTPLVIAAGSAAANILLALILMRQIGVAGLALANSLAVTAEVLVLLLVLRRRWGGVEGRRSLATLARLLVAAAIMSGVVSALLATASSNEWGTTLTLAATGVAGCVSYVGVCWLLRVRELTTLPAVLLGRGA